MLKILKLHKNILFLNHDFFGSSKAKKENNVAKHNEENPLMKSFIIFFPLIIFF